MTYEETMTYGAEEYANVVAALQTRGPRAEFTQTGGMCAAIAVRLEGAELLITDAEDSLSWSQDEHVGWGASIYSLDEEEEDDGPLRHLDLRERARRPAVAGHRDTRSAAFALTATGLAGQGLGRAEPVADRVPASTPVAPHA